MHELKLAIFDVAGTVIEDHGEAVASLVDALAAYGFWVAAKSWPSLQARPIVR